ncbi:hypothetical protein BGX34_009848, partial [Mortierella sp. NVP85]
MAKANKKGASTTSKPRKKRVLQTSSSMIPRQTSSTSKAAIATGKGKEKALDFEARLTIRSRTSGPLASTPRAVSSSSSLMLRKSPETQILSDEGHDSSNNSVEETVESDSEDPDR